MQPNRQCANPLTQCLMTTPVELDHQAFLGDTIAAIQKYDIYEKVSYISTAGGAFLEFLEGKKLPAIEMLERRCNALT